MLPLLAVFALALLQLAAGTTYTKEALMEKSVAELVTVMREKEIDEDEIDLVRSCDTVNSCA